MSSSNMTPAERAELQREQGFTDKLALPLEEFVEKYIAPLFKIRCANCGTEITDESSLASDGVNAAVRVCSACVSER